MSLADLSTEEVAMFQMIEAGFVGVEHHITLLRAKDSSFAKADDLYGKLLRILNDSEEAGYIDTGDAVDLLNACKEWFEQHGPKEPVAVLTLYKRSIRDGQFAVQPVARLLTDPSEVCEPVMEFTEIQDADARHDNNVGESSRSGSDVQPDSEGADADGEGAGPTGGS